jgi:glutathione synthase/RimK-type ligase-like ATP-grasp enzyme
MTLTETLAHTPNLGQPSIIESMRAAARDFGKPPMEQVRELARLCFGPGKLKPEEYFYYGLFGDRYDMGLQRRFVGKSLEVKLHHLTCDSKAWLIAHDKVVCYGVLESLGYPVPKTRAIYRRGASFPGLRTLTDEDALAQALRGGLTGPLFGKPARGIRSAAALSIEGYDADRDILRLGFGQTATVEEIVEAVERYAEDGYLLQDRIQQHPDVTKICGPATATARIVVLLHGGEAEIYRTLWKIPAGDNVADNFWRDGNCLALLDPETGAIQRAVQGIGPGLREIDDHPTSGERLTGFGLPHWPAARELVLSAAHAFPDLRLQAWDVAFGENGPILVEVNVGGDFNLPQLATGAGMLDDRFLDFLRDCATERGLEKDFRRLKLSQAAAG